MGGEQEPKEQKQGTADNGSTVAEYLKKAASTALPLLVSAIVSVGFVAFAGKAVLWARFTALQVPADQVVKAVPQSEAAATGASILLIFGFFGVLAALAVYLLDRSGRATATMSRGLLVVAVIEATVAIWHTNGKPLTSQIVANEIVVLAVGAIFWMTFVAGLTRERSVPGGKRELTEPGGRPRGPFYWFDENGVAAAERERRRAPDPENGIEEWEAIGVPSAAVVAALVAYGLATLVGGEAGWAWVSAVGALGLIFLGAILLHCILFWRKERAARRTRETGERTPAWRAAREREERESRKAAKKAAKRRKKKAKRKRKLLERLAARAGEAGSSGEAPQLILALCDEEMSSDDPDDGNCPEGDSKQQGVDLAPWGIALVTFLAALAIGVPPLILSEWWLAIALAVVAVLGAGLWKIASLSKEHFVWYGLAVFLSVPLFATLMFMASNLAEPQVQPMALIRSTDGADESIQGLYVTETNDRVYFANVAIEGCKSDIRPDSGRLLWVPREEVVAMSVGPLQGVEEASRSALEMAYELTPAVETPAAGAVSLTVPEKQSKAIKRAERKRQAKEVEERAPGLDQRLQDPGPAVRPNFGLGLSLVPEVASPGGDVELRLSRPNGNSGGFGPTPRGRTVRLNGVLVPVLRELSPHASLAEYVITEHHQVLTLQKRRVYGLRMGIFPFPLEGQPYSGPRFVKLEDSDVAEVRGGGLPFPNEEFLRISGNGAGPQLTHSREEKPRVRLTGERHLVSLEPRLLKQAWERDRIAFKVPRHAKSGVVTIDCGQLAGAPLLRVASPPVARIEARMRGGSKRVVLDGRRSRDADGGRLVDRWQLGGRSLGKHKRVALKLQPRKRPYRVRLTVTNPQGVSGSAELLLLRLPESFFEFGKAELRKKKQLEKADRRLERFVRRHPPTSIEIDGNADDVGTNSFNLALSLRRAQRVRRTLLASRANTMAAAPHVSIPVILRAYGETCPIVAAPGRQPANRRVDVFVLARGDTVVTPKRCEAGKEERSRW